MASIMELRWRKEHRIPCHFDCPRCDGPRDGHRVALRPWLGVLGRDCAPLGAPRDFAVCGECGRVYPLRAGTDSPASGTRSEDDRAVLSVVAAVVFSDSRVRHSEKRAARDVVRRYTGIDLDPGDVATLLRSARTRWGDPIARLRRLATLLDEAGKRRIVGAAYLISVADRELHAEETRFLNRIGEALDLPPRELRRAIQSARQNA